MILFDTLSSHVLIFSLALYRLLLFLMVRVRVETVVMQRICTRINPMKPNCSMESNRKNKQMSQMEPLSKHSHDTSLQFKN